VASSKSVIPAGVEKFMKERSEDIEDQAERELTKAAQVINAAVAKLLKAQEEAKARRALPNIDIDEANITEAVLTSCHAIGQATAVLINSATAVQQEFNKLVKAPETRAVYKRSPEWAQV
jgi:hypothetical protein